MTSARRRVGPGALPGFALATMILGLVSVGCGGPEPARGILVVTLDTTRADRIGCYGHQSAQTPAIDGLAADGVLFEAATSPVPVTLPSHSSMFTGLYPPRHGVRYNGMFRLPDSVDTVAEILRDRGWSTAGIPAAFPVHLGSGLDQGFDYYPDVPPAARTGRGNGGERRAEEVTDLGLAWLEERLDGGEDRPFFLWLHYFDPHYPYEPPFPYSSTFRDRPYDGEIAYMDAHIARVFEFLRERGLEDRVDVIVASDHGEGLYDHNEKMHANLVYESTQHVPLVVRARDARRGARVAEPVSLVDLAPTILDLAGAGIPEDLDGVSLVPVLRGDEVPPNRPVYFESLAGALVYGWHPLEGVRDGDWKYIRSSDPELFDLASDPDELVNVAGNEGQRLADLGATLAGLLDRWSAEGASQDVVETPMDAETMDRLASLGYVGGELVDTRRAGRAPKDLIHLESEVFLAREQYQSRRFDDALDTYRRILDEDPENRHALQGAATSAAQLGLRDVARGYATTNVELYPEFMPSRLLLADLAVADGDFELARAGLLDALEYAPDDAAVHYKLALATFASGRPEEALSRLDARIAAGDPPANLQVARAACLATIGRDREAIAAVRTAIAGGYRNVEVLRNEPLLEAVRSIPGFEDVVASIPVEEDA